METFSTCALTIENNQKNKAASLACPSSTYLGRSRRWAQHLGDGRDRWERNVTGANPSRFFTQWFTFCFFNLLPRVHLSLDATTAVCLKLSRHICIEKLFAYQTAGPQSSRHLTDLQEDARADMLECMSPLPPSALCSHIPNNHRYLWRERICVYMMCYRWHSIPLTHVVRPLLDTS